MRRATRLPLEALAPYLLQVPDPRRPIDWPSLFSNADPVEVEVGFGKGLFLLNSALANPGTNYLGIEIERKYQLFTANRIAKRNLANVRLVQADARAFFRDCVSPASIHVIHVYFPDPWWKRRHQKRRLFTADFVAACGHALKTGGQLRLATDVEDYFHFAVNLTTQQPAFCKQPWMNTQAATTDAFLTNFERKARERNHPIFRAAFGRIGVTNS